MIADFWSKTLKVIFISSHYIYIVREYYSAVLHSYLIHPKTFYLTVSVNLDLSLLVQYSKIVSPSFLLLPIALAL